MLVLDSLMISCKYCTLYIVILLWAWPTQWSSIRIQVCKKIQSIWNHACVEMTTPKRCSILTHQTSPLSFKTLQYTNVMMFLQFCSSNTSFLVCTDIMVKDTARVHTLKFHSLVLLCVVLWCAVIMLTWNRINKTQIYKCPILPHHVHTHGVKILTLIITSTSGFMGNLMFTSLCSSSARTSTEDCHMQTCTVDIL